MKAIVIGQNGQLGQTLCRTVPDGIDFKAYDLPEFDVSDPAIVETVITNEKPDVVINACAYTAVDRSEEEADLAFAVNAAGPENLAIAAKKIACRLIHISTDYVFDGTACTPYSPVASCNPLGVYGRSKRAGEVKIQSVTDKAVIIRTSWLYSNYGSNFVLTMLRLMKEKNELQVVFDQIGSPTWAATLSDFIWAIVKLPNLTGIYHWSDAGIASWYDFAVAIQEEASRFGILSKRIPIYPIKGDEFPTKAKRPSYSVLDCTQSWSKSSVTPVYWRVALAKMIESQLNSH